MGVPEIELQLSVNIRQVELGNSQERAFRLLFGVQGRAGDGRVEHELMEVRVVADGMIDDFIDVFRRMLLDADDARTEHADPVRLQRMDQRHRIRSRELAVAGILALQAKPHPVDSQGDQLFHRVALQDVDGAEDFQTPRLAVLFHQVQ